MRDRLPQIVDVVHHDLCIACGACIHACPENVVEPAYNAYRGAHEVRLTDSSSCLPCPAPCDDVCPSIEADLVGLIQHRTKTAQPLDRIGQVEDVFLGYAPEYRDNGISSSGGVNRLLVASALERAQPVICLGKPDDAYRPMLLHSVSDLQYVPGSIYHSVSFAACLDLIQQVDQPCVLVSTPCQLEGIAAYIYKQSPELSKKIGLTVGLICGWMYSSHALNAFASFKRLRPPIRDATYRGEDEKGLLKITTDDGQFRFRRRGFEDREERLDFAAAFSGVLNRMRCRLCQNHLNVLADIAVGDAWLKRKQGEKTSIMVVRTPRGGEVLAELAAQGRLVLEHSDVADLRESQSDNLVYGHVARKLASFRAERGQLTPTFNYGDSPEPVHSNKNDRYDFLFERFLRGVARRRFYRLYRFLYRFYRWRNFGPPRLKRLVKRFSRLFTSHTSRT